MDRCLLAGSNFLVIFILGDSLAFGNGHHRKADQELDSGSILFGAHSKQY